RSHADADAEDYRGGDDKTGSTPERTKSVAEVTANTLGYHDHSALSATAGSMRVARRAGKYAATNATPSNSSDTPTSVTGSVGLTSNNMDESSREPASAPAR